MFVPSANPIPKKAVAVSTSRISYLHDEEVVDGEQTESDSLRKRTRKRKKECMEDKELVEKILQDRHVVRNECQQQEFDDLQAGILNEVYRRK